MRDILVPLPLLHSELAKIREATILVQHSYTVDVDDEDCGEAFCYYMLFTHCPSLLQDQIKLDEEVIFYNRYFWFLRTIKAYKSRYGTDAGMEQQAFQLLEYPPCRLDLELIAHIDSLVDEEVRQ
jgi:hypothetical protein